MPKVIPFAALRPLPSYAKQVAAPPYDVLSSDEARVLVQGNPLSFLHVDKAEINLPEDIDHYDRAVYNQARENLDKLVTDQILTRELKPCLYIYRLAFNKKVQTGLACCVGVADYEQGIIKKHELTRSDKEQDRIDHVMACSAHTGPIFLTYRTDAASGTKKTPRELMEDWTKARAPIFDFDAGDGVKHTVWIVDDADAINLMSESFAEIPYFYIADGHHRSAAAATVAHQAGAEGANFLAVVFPDDELTIMDYNRLLQDLNGHTPESFLAALEALFTIEKKAEPVKPNKINTFGLYLKGEWYLLTLKAPLPADVVDGLAVSVLQREVLAPIFGIENPQTDKRIDFVGGIRGTDRKSVV